MGGGSRIEADYGQPGCTGIAGVMQPSERRMFPHP
jgi:hypothetical protein